MEPGLYVLTDLATNLILDSNTDAGSIEKAGETARAFLLVSPDMSFAGARGGVRGGRAGL